MGTIVNLINRVILNHEDETVIDEVGQEVHALMQGRPLFVV